MSKIQGVGYNLYQIRGKEKTYRFSFDTCQEMKKHFSTRFDTPPEKVDEFYLNCPKWLRKLIEVVEK
ncbi:MAG: hypothetical protein JWO92_1129 [Chitinophagaceae bacterium]|nr:hypothetical protein [Chitinophagaceae bacterium]